MPQVKVTIKGSFDLRAADIDGAELFFKDDVCERDLHVGERILHWSVRGQNGSRFTIKVEPEGGEAIEVKREIDEGNRAFGRIKFTVKEKA